MNDLCARRAERLMSFWPDNPLEGGEQTTPPVREEEGHLRFPTQIKEAATNSKARKEPQTCISVGPQD